MRIPPGAERRRAWWDPKRKEVFGGKSRTARPLATRADPRGAMEAERKRSGTPDRAEDMTEGSEITSGSVLWWIEPRAAMRRRTEVRSLLRFYPPHGTLRKSEPKKRTPQSADVRGTSAEAEQRPAQRERFIGDHGGMPERRKGCSGVGAEPEWSRRGEARVAIRSNTPKADARDRRRGGALTG